MVTTAALNDFRAIITKLNDARQFLAELEAAAGPPTAHLDGLPHGHGGRSDRTAALAAAIADCRTSINRLSASRDSAQGMVETIIAGIDDVQTRTILRLRFVCGLSWGEVAAAIGGRNSADAVKVRAWRFLRDAEKEKCGGAGRQ